MTYFEEDILKWKTNKDYLKLITDPEYLDFYEIAPYKKSVISKVDNLIEYLDIQPSLSTGTQYKFNDNINLYYDKDNETCLSIQIKDIDDALVTFHCDMSINFLIKAEVNEINELVDNFYSLSTESFIEKYMPSKKLEYQAYKNNIEFLNGVLNPDNKAIISKVKMLLRKIIIQPTIGIDGLSKGNINLCYDIDDNNFLSITINNSSKVRVYYSYFYDFHDTMVFIINDNINGINNIINDFFDMDIKDFIDKYTSFAPFL